MSALELAIPFNEGNLFATDWPVKQPKAVVGVIHGFGEHSGRYKHVAGFLNERGFAVTSYDLPGHGRTSGKRGHVANYEVLLASVAAFLQFTRERHPNLPIFLFGHSMGGNILANFLIRRKPAIQAAVVQAPWLRIPYAPPKLEIWLAKTMRYIYPSIQVSSKLDPASISRDPAVVAAYKADPLVHDKITPGWFFGAFEAQEYAISHADQINVPTLVMHGTEDRLAAHSGSVDLVAKGGRSLTFKSWPGLYHELHNEPEQRDVLQFMASWLESQLT
ncbi:lysophospholipase [Fibrella sp. WM1]|uniref:alpha/beta hydrolase n=1 Tax=Fibrella musci TaxID=3242485 RepID=UPI0035220C8D